MKFFEKLSQANVVMRMEELNHDLKLTVIIGSTALKKN